MRTTASASLPDGRCRRAVHFKKKEPLIECASRLGVIGRSHCWDTPERTGCRASLPWRVLIDPADLVLKGGRAAATLTGSPETR
jgi:hypothetical protein